ncbi:putative F-box protein PP2-B12 [Carex littledalei]|uniref:Putative F-box protein PP2-B12 n=1 Tax=Carex littledalei TaxID=544730 RepID=A0A833VR83_9POAL|nr:putative F-box protein PP2-B12 [Carex littledalei]
MEANNSCEISRLPEDCLSHIISLTSLRDTCCCSAVSTSFLSAAIADVVWGNFLPTDIDNILSKIPNRPVFASKKDLYYHLSNRGVIVDDGKMSFRLDRSSSAKIYMLSSSRAVGIIWGRDPRYWQCVPNNNSMFSEVAQLIVVWWFVIFANFRCKNLSPKTKYGAYFIFKLEDDMEGFDRPLEASIYFHHVESHHRICLEARNGMSRQNPNNQIRYPQVRDDQWSEVEIGEFYNAGEEDDEVGVKVHETRELGPKRGLIFNGIEFRPKI